MPLQAKQQGLPYDWNYTNYNCIDCAHDEPFRSEQYHYVYYVFVKQFFITFHSILCISYTRQLLLSSTGWFVAHRIPVRPGRHCTDAYRRHIWWNNPSNVLVLRDIATTRVSMVRSPCRRQLVPTTAEHRTAWQWTYPRIGPGHRPCVFDWLAISVGVGQLLVERPVDWLGVLGVFVGLFHSDGPRRLDEIDPIPTAAFGWKTRVQLCLWVGFKTKYRVVRRLLGKNLCVYSF